MFLFGILCTRGHQSVVFLLYSQYDVKKYGNMEEGVLMEESTQRVKNPVLSEELRDKLLRTCMVCGKSCEGFYGAYGEIGDPPKGTCSKTCEKTQVAKPKYPGHEGQS